MKMKMFLPSDRCNGGSRTSSPKSGQRRRRRQQQRQEALEAIDLAIQQRRDKKSGVIARPS